MDPAIKPRAQRRRFVSSGNHCDSFFANQENRKTGIRMT